MPKKRPKLLLLLSLLGLALLLTSAPALAQEITAAFDISWWTADGGGGSSAGGDYSVDGTLGQPDAGTLTGGGYTIAGGFWDAAADLPIPWGGRIYLPVSLRQFCMFNTTEREPNNLVNEANWLCPNRVVAGAHDGAAGTGDLFTFNTGEAFQVSLSTANSSGVQLLLYVWQDDYLALLEQDATEPFVIAYSPAQNGRYYAYVYSDAGAANTASYTLQTSTGTPLALTEETGGILPTPPPMPIEEAVP